MTQVNAKKSFTLEITSLSYGPYGIGRNEGRVTFVPLTAPQDKLEATLVEEKGNYARGEMIRLLTPSSLRRPPLCPYFGDCGGCSWQHLRYDAQLTAKQKNLEDALRRIGKLDGFDLLPIIPSAKEYHYRRRIRLQMDRQRRLGFFRAFSHDVIEIKTCSIADPSADRHWSRTRDWVRELKTDVRQIEILAGDDEGQVVIAAKADGAFVTEDETACGRFLEGERGISGLVLFGRGWRRVWGQGKISISPEDSLNLEVDGEVFTQVNREGNRTILHELLFAGGFGKQDRVLELYSGAGNFTLPLARRCREVVAIEGHSQSVKNGRANSQANGLDNILWIQSHVPTAVKRMRKKQEQFSKIVLNPPRAGARGLEADLPFLGADKILYVSCNPATLARDLSALSAQGYKLDRVRPIDLFPQTFHVETLAVMTR